MGSKLHMKFVCVSYIPYIHSLKYRTIFLLVLYFDCDLSYEDRYGTSDLWHITLVFIKFWIEAFQILDYYILYIFLLRKLIYYGFNNYPSPFLFFAFI
jgi:hypothetical protein